ncbi:TraX family protein [Halomonas elongata]|uniref:TraX family protein n=1 Tax=Halomonas elongata TaxID=2746 RepID=UPI0040342043
MTAHHVPSWLAPVQGLAIVSMVLDHFAAWWWSGLFADLTRVTLGRFALPMFCLMIAYHALNTDTPRRYTRRILAIALLAQLPFMALTQQPLGNICFTLAAGTALITAYRHQSGWDLLLGNVLALLSFRVEYGPVALGLILAFAVALRHPRAWVLILVVWPLAQYGLSLTTLSAIAAIVLLIALVTTSWSTPRLPRWLTRWFYPLHLWGFYAGRLLS